MAVDENLLEEARRAHDEMRHAQTALVATRARFEQAVRRLHEAGASLDELGEALAVSKDSVNRILGGRGTDLLACSFCRRRQGDVRSLIAGPAVYICDACPPGR